MELYQQTFIELCLDYEVLRFGEFTLKSGRLSPYFFNAGLLNTGNSLAQLGECYATKITMAKLEFDSLFGPAYKGIPLVSATAIALAQHYQKNVGYTFNRKEAKDHGEGGSLVGHPLKGKVLIVDDVITAGTATRESIDIINHHHATPAGIIVAMDRQEKGQGELSAIQEIQNTFNIPVYSLITLDNLLEFVEDHPSFQAYFPALVTYQQKYGINS